MPEKVTVSKEELLAILRANRDNHRAKFIEAQEAFRTQVVRILDERLEQARKGGKIDLYISLPEPEDHTSDYDREIRMLEMEVHDDIEIQSRLFDQIVMDRWSWTDIFAATYTSNTRKAYK